MSAAIEQAFRAAYNLDHDDALALARRAVALGRTSRRRIARSRRSSGSTSCSAAARSPSITTWAAWHDSARRRPSRRRSSTPSSRPSWPRAIELAEARLKQQPRDLQARFDVGAAYALQASYTASVEGSMTSAFRSARRAYDAQEEVLTQDPKRVDAGLVVGTVPLPRLGAGAADAADRVRRGLWRRQGERHQLLEAATRDPDTRVDAKMALMLIYSREGRHADVVTLARELRTEFPRNRLFMLEEGAAAIRAGRAADAEAVLTRGLASSTRTPARSSRASGRIGCTSAAWPASICRHLGRRASDLHTAPAVAAGRLGARPDPPRARKNRRSGRPAAGRGCGVPGGEDASATRQRPGLCGRSRRVCCGGRSANEARTAPRIDTGFRMALAKKWIWIVVIFLGVCVVALLAVAGAGVYFVAKHIDMEASTTHRRRPAFDAVQGAVQGSAAAVRARLSRARECRAPARRPADAPT